MQIRPLAADLAPACMRVHGSSLRAHTANLGNGITQLILNQVARHDIGRKIPAFQHPIHPLESGRFYLYLRKLLSALRPAVDHEHFFKVHTIVPRNDLRWQSHKGAQLPVTVVCPLADASVLHAVAAHFVIHCCRCFHRVKPWGYGLGVKIGALCHQRIKGFFPGLLAHDFKKIRNVAFGRHIRAGVCKCWHPNPQRTIL